MPLIMQLSHEFSKEGLIIPSSLYMFSLCQSKLYITLHKLYQRTTCLDLSTFRLFFFEVSPGTSPFFNGRLPSRDQIRLRHLHKISITLHSSARKPQWMFITVLDIILKNSLGISVKNRINLCRLVIRVRALEGLYILPSLAKVFQTGSPPSLCPSLNIQAYQSI